MHTISRIALTGAHNTRDLGGFPTQDGRRIREKRLLRSGALAALTELYTLESVSTVIKQRFQGEVGQKNADAARAAYDYVMQKKEEARDAATN